MRIGVVCFDSATNLSVGDKTFASLDSGWASISGEPARRISTVHELASDTLWITNLTEAQFFGAKLHAHPNFRSEGYLRSSLRHLYSELGVDPIHVSSDKVARVLATVAQRVVDYGETRLGVYPRSKALNEDFAAAMKTPMSQVPDDMYNVLRESAEHAYVRTLQSNTHVNGGKTLTLRRNRLLHARDLLSRLVPPDVRWDHLPAASLPKGEGAIERMLEKSGCAFLVDAEVSDVNPHVAEVFSIGGGARSIRRWLTDVEWRMAREWADIRYNGVLMCCEPSAAIAQRHCLPSGDYAPLSITCSLVAEQVWTAMTIKRGGRDEPRYTAAAAWIRAFDRVAMFDYAQRLYALGLNVWGYGGGNVVIQYPEGGLKRTLDVVTDTGLLAPASKLLEAARPLVTEGVYGTA
jgi:hypothetical protein